MTLKRLGYKTKEGAKIIVHVLGNRYIYRHVLPGIIPQLEGIVFFWLEHMFYLLKKKKHMAHEGSFLGILFT